MSVIIQAEASHPSCDERSRRAIGIEGDQNAHKSVFCEGELSEVNPSS